MESKVSVLARARWRAHAAAIAVALATTLVGCTAATEAPTESSSDTPLVNASEEVVAAVADNEITRDEYDAGYRRFAACMDEGGTPVVEHPMEEDTYYFSIPDSAVQSGLYDDCYSREFYAIDLMWQLAHPTISTQLAECLFLAGDDFIGTPDEMRERLIEIGEDPDACLAKN